MIICHKFLKSKKVIPHLLFIMFIIMILGIGTVIGWHYLLYTPYIIQVDCRGKEITVDTIKEWEKQQNGSLGLLRIAGWRIDEDQMVSSIDTGRKQNAQIYSIYGSMEIIKPAKILCGRYGLPIEEEYCVLSEPLSQKLFGSTDIAGEKIKIKNDILSVAGVIKTEKEILFFPVNEGKIETLTIEFNNRINAKKIKELTGFSP